jgi:uncharacterized membrane protein
MELYPILRLIHIVSSTLLFGTGLGSAYYMWQAHRTGDAGVVAAVARNVVLADWMFTAPAVIVQPLTGIWLMKLLGYDFSLDWLRYSLILFVVAGLCWLPVVWIQIRVRNLAAQAASDGKALSPQYHQLMRYWFALGWPAFLSVLVIFVLMVFKLA